VSTKHTHSAGYRMIPILNAVPIPLGPTADIPLSDELCSRWTILTVQRVRLAALKPADP